MSATLVLGSQWGDEGKGKLTDILCASTRICARAQGGNNAGHTIYAGGKAFHFHLLPSGLMNANTQNLIGSGVVVHVPSLFKELQELEEKGLERVRERLFVSDRAQCCLDLHALVDGIEEGELKGNSIGTTRKGIGPAYSTKMSRSGVRISDVFHKEAFDAKIRELARGYKLRYGDLLTYDPEKEIAKFDKYRPQLASLVVDAVPFMASVQERDLPILIEGANALMLDIDYGTFPFVTSSNTGLGGIFTGLALNPRKIKDVIGVVKAYTTRVGGGPFPTEDLGEAGTKLQEIGKEYGVTTGRRRRTGWLDLVVIKYSQSINYYTQLNLTKLDVLDTFETIKIAIGYKDPETDEDIDSFPADLDILGNVKIVYHEMPGWNKSTTGIKTYYDLPKAARDYVEYIEKFIGVKITYIGTGPDREDMILRA